MPDGFARASRTRTSRIPTAVLSSDLLSRSITPYRIARARRENAGRIPFFVPYAYISHTYRRIVVGATVTEHFATPYRSCALNAHTVYRMRLRSKEDSGN